MMMRYDMQPHGVNSADEDLNGIAPNLATETCDVSDFIFSSSWLYRITGHTQYGDRLEKAFHNAAPAAVNRSFEGYNDFDIILDPFPMYCFSFYRPARSHAMRSTWRPW